MSRWFWGRVWVTAEYLHINMGRAAPWVFRKMMGSRPAVRVK